MKKNLKTILSFLLCLPIVFFSGCASKPSCKTIKDLSYYYDSTIVTNIFNQTQTRKLELTDLTSSKLHKEKADAFAQFTLTAKTAEAYHLYIEYIYFKVYTNEDSEFPLDININISNVIHEEDVGNSEAEDVTFSNTYSLYPQKKKSFIVKAEVKRLIRSATGSQITIDVLTSDMFSTGDSETETTFKWLIYDFEIYGESRA